MSAPLPRIAPESLERPEPAALPLRLGDELVSPLCCVFPAICLALILTAPWITGVLFDGRFAFLTKATQEWVGPATLLAAIAVAALCGMVQRSAGLLWLALLAGNFFLRELHFRATNEGVYVGFAVLVAVVCLWPAKFTGLLRHRTAMTWLASALATYALAVSLDQNAWRFLPGRKIWAANMEETLETLGHLQVLAGIVCLAAFHPAVNSSAVSESSSPRIRQAA